MSQIHRENPDAAEEEIEALQIANLIFAPLPNDYPYETRRCRDCQRPFSVNVDRPTNTKWGALCGSCLAWEV